MRTLMTALTVCGLAIPLTAFSAGEKTETTKRDALRQYALNNSGRADKG